MKRQKSVLRPDLLNPMTYSGHFILAVVPAGVAFQHITLSHTISQYAPKNQT